MKRIRTASRFGWGALLLRPQQAEKRQARRGGLRVLARGRKHREDAQRVADDLLKGNHGNLYTIVCRVNAKLVKHGRAAFKRGWVRAEEKLWRLGA